MLAWQGDTWRCSEASVAWERKHLPSLERSINLSKLAYFSRLDAFEKGTNIKWEAKGYRISFFEVGEQGAEDACGWRGGWRSRIDTDMTEPLSHRSFTHRRIQARKVKGARTSIAADERPISTAR